MIFLFSATLFFCKELRFESSCLVITTILTVNVALLFSTLQCVMNGGQNSRGDGTSSENLINGGGPNKQREIGKSIYRYKV